MPRRGASAAAVPLCAGRPPPYVAHVAGAITDGQLNGDFGPCRVGDRPW
ncbi:MAG: hypothetical protein IPO67_31775 [Deltaproteobacteria bacterium]|nr:hypothetical protein [Deltaproteobacteria bacterium]